MPSPFFNTSNALTVSVQDNSGQDLYDDTAYNEELYAGEADGFNELDKDALSASGVNCSSATGCGKTISSVTGSGILLIASASYSADSFSTDSKPSQNERSADTPGLSMIKVRPYNEAVSPEAAASMYTEAEYVDSGYTDSASLWVVLAFLLSPVWDV